MQRADRCERARARARAQADEQATEWREHRYLVRQEATTTARARFTMFTAYELRQFTLPNADDYVNVDSLQPTIGVDEATILTTTTATAAVAVASAAAATRRPQRSSSGSTTISGGGGAPK